MKHQESFEAHWKEKFAWEMKRGVRGRGGYSLDIVGDKYIADRVQFAYEIWCAAKESK